MVKDGNFSEYNKWEKHISLCVCQYILMKIITHKMLHVYLD